MKTRGFGERRGGGSDENVLTILYFVGSINHKLSQNWLERLAPIYKTGSIFEPFFDLVRDSLAALKY